MEIYEGITLGAIALGILFVIIGFTFNKTKERWREDELAKEDDAFRSQVSLVDEKILEMNEYYGFIKEEIEKKHKELLFLYQMIGEKEKAIRSIQLEIQMLQKGKAIVESVDSGLAATEESPVNHNRKIIQLKEQGYTPKEIAKVMSIGQGEVQLVLNLFE